MKIEINKILIFLEQIFGVLKENEVIVLTKMNNKKQIEEVFYLDNYKNNNDLEKFFNDVKKDYYWHLSTRNLEKMKTNWLLEIVNDTFYSSYINNNNLKLELINDLFPKEYDDIMRNNNFGKVKEILNEAKINEYLTNNEQKKIINNFVDKYFLGLKQKGKKNSLVRTIGYWVDVDISPKDENKFSDIESSIRFLGKEISINPSILINSGNGLHVYYLFDELINIENENDLVEFETKIETLSNYLGSKAIKENITKSIDNCDDSTRMLRLPFTYNCKQLDNLKEVKILHLGKRREMKIYDDFIFEVNKDFYNLKKEVIRLEKQNKIIKDYINKENTKREGLEYKIKFGVNGELDREKVIKQYQETTPLFKNIYNNCAFVNHYINNPNEATYHIRQDLVRLIKLYDDKDKYYDILCSVDTAKRRKQIQLLEVRNSYGGATCSTILSKSDKCLECPFFKSINSPCSLQYNRNKLFEND